MENSRINRRKFLGAGLAAAATVTVGKSLASPLELKRAPIQASNDLPFNPMTFSSMPTRAFGKTGYKVGIFSLGAQATLEIAGKEEEAEKILHRAIDLGVNYIDTAASYGRGVSQLNVGRVMKSRRNEVWLATKTHDRTYDGSMRLLEESLKNLQTDHLDTWQLHNIRLQEQVDQVFAPDGAIKALEKAKSEGIVRCVGITGHYEPIVLLEAIKRYPFDSLLLAMNAADVHYLSFKNYLLPEAQKRGIATIGMKVATRGRVLSEWTPPPLEEQTDARSRTSLRGTVSIKEALSYNMSLPVSTTIIGVDTIEQLEENVNIASQFSPLTREEMEQIEFKTLPIVRQALYFRRWDVGA